MVEYFENSGEWCQESKTYPYKQKVSLLQKNDNKSYHKNFCFHNQNTERIKKRILEVFTSPQTENPFRTALPSNQNNPCSKMRFYSGKKKGPRGNKKVSQISGTFYYSNSHSRGSSSPFQKPSCKYSGHSNGNHFQQAAKNNFHEQIKVHSSNNKSFIHIRLSHNSTSRKVFLFQQGEGNFNQRSEHFVSCKWVQNSTAFDSTPGQNLRSSAYVKNPSKNNIKQNQKIGRKESHQ